MSGPRDENPYPKKIGKRTPENNEQVIMNGSEHETHREHALLEADRVQGKKSKAGVGALLGWA